RSYGPGPVKMLGNGDLCRVWTETDDQGVTRYVCHEAPKNIPVWVRITDDATGDFAGIIGCYDAVTMVPLPVAPLGFVSANAFAPKTPPTGYSFSAIAAEHGN